MMQVKGQRINEMRMLHLAEVLFNNVYPMSAESSHFTGTMKFFTLQKEN